MLPIIGIVLIAIGGAILGRGMIPESVTSTVIERTDIDKLFVTHG
jgi:hypothetical protein